MKILSKTLAAITLVVCICFMNINSASAKVCFASDPGCSGGADFGDNYTDDSQNLCIAEGYNVKSADCRADVTKNIGGHCPYNANYVICCGKEYAYSSCVYPLMDKGKCGSKSKCDCDSAKYKYTSQSCRTSFKNSLAGGASCAHISGYNPAEGTTATQIYYTSCTCDRGLYPYTEEDCSKNSAAVHGDGCTDNNNVNYYSSCICDDRVYKVKGIECEFGGKGKMCLQGGVYYYEDCCPCDMFPAVGSQGKPNDANAITYNSCPCEPNKRFKITKCGVGYKPNSNGSACVPLSCGEYLRDVRGMRVATTIDELKVALSNGSNTYDEVIYAPLSPSTSWQSIDISYLNAATLSSGQAYGSQYSLWCGSTARPKVKFENKLSSTGNVKNFNYMDIYFSASSSGFSVSNNVRFNNSYAEFYWGATLNNGASMTNSQMKFADKTTVYGNVAFNNSQITVTGSYDFIISGSGVAVKNSSFNGGTGDIIINNSFSPENTDFNVKSITVNSSFDYNVFFKGSSAKRIKVEAESMSVRGIAGFNYADVYIQNTCIGCTYNNGKPSNLFKEGSVTLYNTKWYLYVNSVPYNVYLGTRNVLGTPNPSNFDAFASTNSYIVTSRSSRLGMYNEEQKHSYCSSGNACGSNSIYYINSSGLKSKGPHICDTMWCQHRGKGNNSSSRNGGGFVRFDGNEGRAGVEGGNDCCSAFQ